MSRRPTTPPAAWMTAANLALARTLWDEGLSTNAIARRVGTTKNGLLGYAHRNRWPPRPSPIGVRKGEVWQAREPPPRKPEQPHRKPVEGVPRRASPKTPPAPRAACNPLPLAAPTVVFRGCQFPLNDHRPWRWCGAATDGGPWCPIHFAKVYVSRERFRALEAA